MEIRLLVMDVDGTLTDGSIYVGDNGEAFKRFNVRDGYGIHDILPEFDIKPVILTGRASKCVEIRAQELGITEIYQGVSNKTDVLKSLVTSNGHSVGTVAYIGDDLNDLTSMQYVKDLGGIVGCPRDAVENVKRVADFVSRYNGGNGAVRDFIEWIVGT